MIFPAGPPLGLTLQSRVSIGEGDKMRLSFQEVKTKIAKMIPKDIDYKIDLEAATVSIITKNPDRFGSGSGLTGEIAKSDESKIEG